MIELLIGVVYLIGWAFTGLLGGWHLTRAVEGRMMEAGYERWRADDHDIRGNLGFGLAIGLIWPASLPALLISMLCEALPKYQLVPDWAVALIRRRDT